MIDNMLDKQVDNMYNTILTMIKAQMKEKGVSQRELVRRTNFGVSSISEFLSNKHPISFTRLMKILYVLDLQDLIFTPLVDIERQATLTLIKQKETELQNLTQEIEDLKKVVGV